MKSLWNTLQITVTVIGGYIGWFLGGYDKFLYALIVFVVADYITGVMAAIINKKLSSKIGARGILKKILIFVLIGIGHIIDSRIIGNGGAIRTAVIFFYLSNEGISILENTSMVGLPIPKKLKDILEQINTEDGDNNNIK